MRNTMGAPSLAAQTFEDRTGSLSIGCDSIMLKEVIKGI